MNVNAKFNAEEIFYIASIIDNSPHKTRRAAIDNMELATVGNIVSDQEREFTRACIVKLEQITDADFNRINFLSGWSLVGADERDVG